MNVRPVPTSLDGAPAPADELPLRLWLRLLGSANLVLARLRTALRDEFDITMPAFDLLAQVHRAPKGPTMGQLSQRLMVSKGNVTDLVERIEARGLIRRESDAGDGRVQHVYLTSEGEALVARMLPAHRAWLTEMTAGIDERDLARLYHLLGTFKATLAARTVKRRPGRLSAKGQQQ